MTEYGNSASRLKPDEEYTPPPEHLLRRRRRRRCVAWTCCALVTTVAILALLVLILALTVFKPRDPRTTLVSATVEGVAPRVTLPALQVELNVTLGLDLLVYNPNRVAFSNGPGRTALSYHGTSVGDAVVAPGRIPSRGSAHVYSRLTIQADRFAADPATLVADVLAGRIGVDTSTRVPGRVTLLGFVRRHVVALSDCHVVIGFPNVTVLEQQCRQKTKL